jgi:outer membrane protein
MKKLTMKNIFCKTLVITTFLFSSLVYSLTNKGVPLPVNLPSVIDYTSVDGWSGAVGLKMEYSPFYKGSDHYTLEIKPEGAVQWRSGKHIYYWENFDLNNTELGWRRAVASHLLIEAGVKHETVIPSGRSESSGIVGLPHRGSHVFGFIDVKNSINSNWRNWVSGRLSVGSSLYGWLGELSAGHNFGKGTDNTGVELLVFSTFGSKSHLNNFFGISETDSTLSGLKIIDLDSGYRSTGLMLVYRENIFENMQIKASTSMEFYSSNIEKSELVSGPLETGAEISMLWKF